jgi:hypothetical protein
MKANFEVHISRVHGHDTDGKEILLSVTDRASRARILEAYFGLADFMEILTGRIGNSAGDFYEDTPVGYNREHKEETVPRPKLFTPNRYEEKIILSPYEIDGWKGRVEDLYNSRRWVDTDRVSVVFSRFVHPDGTVWKGKE